MDNIILYTVARRKWCP